MSFPFRLFLAAVVAAIFFTFVWWAAWWYTRPGHDWAEIPIIFTGIGLFIGLFGSCVFVMEGGRR